MTQVIRSVGLTLMVLCCLSYRYAAPLGLHPLFEGALGTILFILTPLVVVLYKRIPFPQIINQWRENKYMALWSIGSVIWLILFALNSLTLHLPIPILVILIVAINAVYDAIQLWNQKHKTLGDTKLFSFNLLSLWPLVFIYTYYYVFYWRLLAPAYTQITDLYNHNTIANALLEDKFSILPSHLSASFQSDAYTTVYHVVLAISRVSFSSYGYFQFQFIMQFVLIAITYIIFERFALYIGASKYVAILIGIIVSIINGPNLSLIRYAPVPNEIVFLLVPFFFVLIDQIAQSSNAIQKRRLWYMLIVMLIVSALFHLPSTLLLLPLFVLLLKHEHNDVRLKWLSYILPALVIFIVVVQGLMRINLSQVLHTLVLYLGKDSGLLRGATEATASSNALLFASGFGVMLWLGFMSHCFYAPFLIRTRYYVVGLCAGVIFLATQLSLPYFERIGSLVVAMTVPLFFTELEHLVQHYVGNGWSKVVLTATLVLLVISQIVSPLVFAQENYSGQFWYLQNLEMVRGADRLLSNNNVQSKKIFVVSDPMTKMIVESILGIPGSGTYAKGTERIIMSKILVGHPTECLSTGYEYELRIWNQRTLQWIDLPRHETELTNVWFDVSTNETTAAKLKELFTQMGTSKTILTNDYLIELVQC